MGLRNRYLFKEEKCFFVTTTCVHWLNLIDYSNSYQILEESLNFVSNKYKALIFAYVIMPNHIHVIVYFKEVNRLSDFMRDFKKFTSTMIRKRIDQFNLTRLLSKLRTNKNGRSFQVWKDRFDDVYLTNKHILEQKIDYINFNPLQSKWSLVKRPEDYKYSSAQFYELGIQSNCKVSDYRNYF